MEIVDTRLEGPILVRPVVHRDPRGFFTESYRRERFGELGITDEFVQDNHSRSERGVVRGMHFQEDMAKLVRCPRGAILDVLVDIRRGSATFGEWESFELNEDNLHALYCPIGFAHGFCVTSEDADVEYKCSSYYDPGLEGGIAYNDPEVGIEWPDIELIPSERDANAPTLSAIEAELPFEYRAASANVDLVRSIYAPWERGDFSSAEWAHPEIEFVFADGPSPGTWTGVDAMAKAWSGMLSAWEGLQARIEEVRELDQERVLVLLHNIGRGKQSGLELGQIQTRSANLFHLHAGKVTRMVVYWDRDRAFADLGLPPD